VRLPLLGGPSPIGWLVAGHGLTIFILFVRMKHHRRLLGILAMVILLVTTVARLRGIPIVHNFATPNGGTANVLAVLAQSCFVQIARCGTQLLVARRGSRD
jgi:hypothetical protein